MTFSSPLSGIWANDLWEKTSGESGHSKARYIQNEGVKLITEYKKCVLPSNPSAHTAVMTVTYLFNQWLANA